MTPAVTTAVTTYGAADSPSRRAYAWLLAAASIATALLTAWPWIRFDMEQGGAALPLVGVVDGEFYVFLLRRAAEGFTDSANHLLLEHRGPTGHADEELVRRIASLPLHWTGASAHHVVLTMTAVCAGLHTLLFAAIARTLGVSRLGSVATALACCLVPNVFAWYGGGCWLFSPGSALLDFLPLARPLHPSVSGLVLWGGALAAVRFVRDRSWIALAACAGLTWVSWDVYRPVFPLLGTFLLAACIGQWLRGDRKAALWTAAAGAVVLATRAPAVLSTIGAEDLTNGMGVPRTAPILNANIALLAGVAAAALLLRRLAGAATATFAAAAAAATILVWNQQVVTGRIFQPFHYDWFWTTPFTWLAAAGALTAFRGAPAVLAKAVAWLVIGLSLWSGWKIQDFARARRSPFYRSVQDQSRAFHWLRTNAGPDDVALFARDESARLYAAHTGRPVFTAMEVQFVASAPDERERRMRRLVQFDAFGVRRDEIAASMDDRSPIHWMLFGWRSFGAAGPRVAAVMHTNRPPPLDPSVRTEVLALHDELAARPVADRLRTFRLDWIVWTDDAPAPFREPKHLPVVAEGKGWRIRAVR